MLRPIPLDPVLLPQRRAAEVDIPHIRAGTIPFPHMIRYASLTRALHAFLLRHRVPSLRPTAPRIFLCVGEPGSGKTRSLANALAESHNVVVGDATIFAASHEGENVEALNALMTTAEKLARARDGTPSVVLLDDVDCVFALPEGTSRTANNELARLWLQTSLADRKDRFLQHDGVSRIPVVMTANSLATAHAATFRDGRAALLLHEPTKEERATIVAHHLRPATTWERRIVRRLARKYATAPLSFFAEISARLDAERLETFITGKVDIEAIERELAKPRPLTGDALRIARELWSARATVFGTA